MAKPSVDVVKAANTALNEAESRRKELLQKYKAEKKVPVYLSPMYRPHFGNVMQVSINGITIFFAVDGTTQYIPESFADEITARRMATDDILNKQSLLANVSANNETSPGELKLF